MAPYRFLPVKCFSGEVSLPGDKSISHRAIMCGALADGITEARGVLDCDDCNYTRDAFRSMGVKIEKKQEITTVFGAGLDGLKRPAGPIDVGSSGTSMRILSGILAGQKFSSKIIGSGGLSGRPMARVIDPLVKMGARIVSRPGGFAPLDIEGCRLRPIEYEMPVSSAQVKSAILFAGLYADGDTVVKENVKSRDHTERMMRYFGLDIREDGPRVTIRPGKGMSGRRIDVPGDISSASFFAAGAILLRGSSITIKRVSVNPSRAGILGIFERMGAPCNLINRVDAFEPYADLEVRSGPLKAVTIEAGEIPGIIDELPVIFVLAALAKGRTVIKGAGELRVKETDRIASMKDNLGKMGVSVSVNSDEIYIDGVAKLKGADFKSYGDHRTCMSMAIAAMAADGESSIDDVECVNKSLPEFFSLLESVKC